jgi:diguanylate cyclase (GGDEF)-like protein/putative nucleotidyltransferase with HDIG domain
VAPIVSTTSTLFGRRLQYLPLSVSGMVALFMSARLWQLQQPGTAMAVLLAAAAAGLGVQYGRAQHEKALGYLLGLGCVGFAATITHHHAHLAYALWAMLGAIVFPGWRAALAIGGAWLMTFFVARWSTGENVFTFVDLTTVGTIGLVYLGTLFLAREGESRAELALSDPLTGIANRRMLTWRLTEELADLRRTGATLALLYFNLVEFKNINALFGHHAGDRALTQVARIFQDHIRAHDLIARFGDDKFVLMAPGLGDEHVDQIFDRLQAAVSRARLPLPVGLSVGWVVAPRDARTAEELLELVNKGLFEQKGRPRKAGRSLTMQLAEALRVLPDGVQQLIRLLDNEEVELEEHLAHVGRWCLEIARSAGLEDERCQALSQAALLHDVGKLALPRALLRKPGRLTREEHALLVRHVTSGVALLRVLGVDATVLGIIAAHHERWDGTGYPSGTAGEAIPLEARILALADTYDAIISTRVYQPARTPDEAIAELEREAGHQFDPHLVARFVSLLRTRKRSGDRREHAPANPDEPARVAAESSLLRGVKP